MSKMFGLNLIPLPENDFGPEQAKTWIESELPGYAAIAQCGYGKNRQNDGCAFHFIVGDIGTMAAACVEAIATGEPVEFAYNDYSGHLGERHRAQSLAEILSNPEVFADCHERRDTLLPVLAEQVVEFLEEEGRRLD